MIDKTRLHLILNEYKKDFAKLFWTNKTQNEKYKWVAVKHFQDNWDIEAPDFLEMFTEATAKTENLLSSMNYFPRGMMIEFCKADPEKVKKMFRDLFDEKVSVVTRVESFIKDSEQLRVKYQPESGWKSHYQNANSITTYLWLRYPDKYYIYKYSECKSVANELDNSYKPAKGAKPETLLGAINLYDEIAEYLATDKELINIVNKHLDDTCYPDPKFRTLTIDVGFYISRFYKDKPKKTDLSGWWPSLEDYNPNLTKNDWKKYILEVEKLYHSSPMKMLKGMLHFDGEAGCKKLAQKFGGTPSVYVGCTVNIGRRVKNYFSLPACMDGDQERYFSLPFLGKKGSDGEYIYKLRPELFEALTEIDLSDISPYYIEEDQEMNLTDVAKNTILYGPPGTGKTYRTVCYAVAIIENKSPKDILNEASGEGGYQKVLDRYKMYREQGLVAFTTFHQSYGYEEFIEGIKPITQRCSDDEEEADIKYARTDGIFKEFCDQAYKYRIIPKELDIKNKKVWSILVDSDEEFDLCIDYDSVGVKSYGVPKRFTDETLPSGLPRDTIDTLINFKSEITKGDIVVLTNTANMRQRLGVITGDVKYDDLESDNYPRRRDVVWYKENMNVVDVSACECCRLDIDTMDMVEVFYDKKIKNYVFIIDEINRGNISKIFGELITLIETSKRLGAEEELTATLPYSKKPFGIPENVYILGTMNTADRSIATLDTAIRRRFDFIEMMPDKKVLEGIDFDGIDISEMLEKMNERITVLFDREHTIGHAYFIGLKDNPNMVTLANIFKNKVIPLLQEYFYEDYERIRLVLADNQVSETEKQFITAETVDVTDLFGNSDIDIIDDTKRYKINDDAFDSKYAYIKIYNA